jgi:hypothetical protein
MTLKGANGRRKREERGPDHDESRTKSNDVR